MASILNGVSAGILGAGVDVKLTFEPVVDKLVSEFDTTILLSEVRN